MANQNPYSVLGLRKGVSEDELKQAYVELVKKFDPEKHTDHFMVIQHAYETLRDPSKRAREDILIPNHVRGRFLFLGEEQMRVPDAQINARILDAEKAFRAAEDNPQSRDEYVKSLMTRSYIKVSRKLWAEAIDDWKTVLNIDSTHQRAKNNILYALITLGYSYAEHDLNNEALELWERAVQMNPDRIELLHNMAIVCERVEKTDQAQRYWQESLRRWQGQLDRDPDNAYLRNLIIEVHRHLGGQTAQPGVKDAPKSINEYKEILKINPNDFEAQYRIATTLYEEQKWEEATRSLDQISRKYPKNIEVLNMLGWALINSGHPEQAFQIWNRSLSIDPKNTNTREAIIKARMSMGKVFRSRGMHTQSLVNFKALLRFIPRSPEVYMEIGQTYMYKGDKRSAAQAFDMVLKLDPKNRAAKQYLSDMKLRT
ncbi:tetratricopeptide repeat protein [Candidatus Sumerlaeota bacterium]|nr:tetratricopeptide repeat protein [Candidatus Sumerlaeota bacterium]